MKVRSIKHKAETAAERTKGKERSQSVKRERGGQDELRDVWSPLLLKNKMRVEVV